MRETRTIDEKRIEAEPRQSFSIPCGANNQGFINGNRDAKAFRETDSAATVPQYCFEPFEVNGSEFGGELARF